MTGPTANHPVSTTSVRLRSGGSPSRVGAPDYWPMERKLTEVPAHMLVHPELSDEDMFPELRLHRDHPGLRPHLVVHGEVQADIPLEGRCVERELEEVRDTPPPTTSPGVLPVSETVTGKHPSAHPRPGIVVFPCERPFTEKNSHKVLSIVNKFWWLLTPPSR